MKSKGNIFLNIMTSGKPLFSRDEATMDVIVRYILLNSMIFLGCTLLVVFGYESFERGAFYQAAFDFSMAGMTLLAFVVLRTAAPYIISGFMTVVPYMLLCAFLAISGGPQGSGFPPPSLFPASRRLNSIRRSPFVPSVCTFSFWFVPWCMNRQR